MLLRSNDGISEVIEFPDEIEGLFISDHTLVGTLHFIHVNDVNVSFSALVEACWKCHFVKEISVKCDVFKFLFGTGCYKRGDQSHVLLSAFWIFIAHYFF